MDVKPIIELGDIPKIIVITPKHSPKFSPVDKSGKKQVMHGFRFLLTID